MEKYLILNETDGIYVGNALGFCFWSKLDSVGQPAVPVFDSLADALQHVAEFHDRNDPSLYTFPTVSVEHAAEFATASQLREAGLEEHMGAVIEHLATHSAPGMLV
jgi:hypothetical protein